MNGGKKSCNVLNVNQPIFVKMASKKVSKIINITIFSDPMPYYTYIAYQFLDLAIAIPVKEVLGYIWIWHL